jgi:hypothetical protein
MHESDLSPLAFERSHFIDRPEIGATMPSDRADTNWENANKAFILFQDYLHGKTDRFDLAVTDLMYISNFKGGNASVSGTTPEIVEKLESYSAILRRINEAFGDRSLCDLSPTEVESLIVLCLGSFTTLDANRIKGFSHSYWSAMLCAFFPSLLPILDRWIVANLDITHEKDSQGQVKNLQQHNPEVIRRFYKLTISEGLSIRELDKRLFVERPE